MDAQIESAAAATVAKVDADIAAHGYEVVLREIIPASERHATNTFAARFRVRLPGGEVRINVRANGKVQQGPV